MLFPTFYYSHFIKLTETLFTNIVHFGVNYIFRKNTLSRGCIPIPRVANPVLSVGFSQGSCATGGCFDPPDRVKRSVVSDWERLLQSVAVYGLENVTTERYASPL